MFDTILRGGTVIDGTGRPAFPADVGITAGHHHRCRRPVRRRRGPYYGCRRPHRDPGLH